LQVKFPSKFTVDLLGGKLKLLGINFQKLMQIGCKLQSLKIPDCYKSKGVSFEYKKYPIKKGKKE